MFRFGFLGTVKNSSEDSLPVAFASGKAFPIWNTVVGTDKLLSLSIHGLTEQNGTPTPEVPVPIQSVGDSGLLLSIMQDKTGGDYQLLDIGGAMRKAGYDGVLRSAGAVYDEIKYNGKEWTFQKRIHTNKVVRTSVNANSYLLTDDYAEMWFYNFPSDNGQYRPYALCNCLTNSNAQGTFTANSFSTFGSRIYVRLPISYDTADKFLAWIDNNDVFVTYAISNSEIPAPVILELPIISTYNGQTYFATNAAMIKPRMVAECLVKKAVEYIKKNLCGYWTGRSRNNTEKDKEILPDFSGNFNNLQNYNFAYTLDSGYGDGYIQYDGRDDYSSNVQYIKGISTIFFVSEMSEMQYSSIPWNLSAFKTAETFGLNNGKLSNGDRESIAYYNGYQIDASELSIRGKELNTCAIIDATENFKLCNFCIGTLQNRTVACCLEKIYDVLIYDRILSPEEVLQNHNVSLQFNGDNFDGPDLQVKNSFYSSVKNSINRLLKNKSNE